MSCHFLELRSVCEKILLLSTSTFRVDYPIVLEAKEVIKDRHRKIERIDQIRYVSLCPICKGRVLVSGISPTVLVRPTPPHFLSNVIRP